MKLLSVCVLLVCSSALWVPSSSSSSSSPPDCDSILTFSDVSPPTDGHGSIHSRSLSPWRWRWSVVRGRIPSTLWEAECSSSNSSCLSHSSPRPIYQRVLVLTRKEGQRCYTASYQSVAVGCTCVSATTQLLQPQP